MPKKNRQNKSVSSVDEVMWRLGVKKPEKKKRTLNLSKDQYSEFETMCRAKNRYPSDVIDEFIALCNEKWRNE
jgi:hypothetical protein